MDCQEATRIDCPCNEGEKAHEMRVGFVASFASRKLSKVWDEHLVSDRSPSALLPGHYKPNCSRNPAQRA